jgi:hypothetical protein
VQSDCCPSVIVSETRAVCDRHVRTSSGLKSLIVEGPKVSNGLSNKRKARFLSRKTITFSRCSAIRMRSALRRFSPKSATRSRRWHLSCTVLSFGVKNLCHGTGTEPGDCVYTRPRTIHSRRRARFEAPLSLLVYTCRCPLWSARRSGVRGVGALRVRVRTLAL